MDTIALVENRIDDGQQLLDRLRESGIEVRAASWVKPLDEDRWSLYIATPLVDKDLVEAYRHVFNVLRDLTNVAIDGSEVKLIGENHPVTKEVIESLKLNSSTLPVPLKRSLLGGMPVEEIYVYPLKDPVKISLYGMIFPGEPSGSLHLSFAPHNPKSQLQIGSAPESKEYKAETGVDWIVAVPPGARLERNRHGVEVLAWELHGRRHESRAQEVWSLAMNRVHGFRFLREPSNNRTHTP